jgi:hypothetical protein
VFCCTTVNAAALFFEGKALNPFYARKRKMALKKAEKIFSVYKICIIAT